MRSIIADADRMSEKALSPDRIRSEENLAFMDQFGSEVARRFKARLAAPDHDDEITDRRA